MFPLIINLLYPAQCLACGEKTASWDRGICGNCQKKIKKRLPPFCAKCGRQISTNSKTNNICAYCMIEKLYFDRALSVFHYDGIIKNLIHEFKYKNRLSLSNDFTELAAGFIKEHAIGKEADIVLSIPMHPLKLFKREINASDVLARKIAKILNCRHSAKVLKKTRNTASQSRLSRRERIENVKQSFSVNNNKKSEIKNKNILLVDDLFTSGNTVNECAKALKKASSGHIEVLTLARGDRLT